MKRKKNNDKFVKEFRKKRPITAAIITIISWIIVLMTKLLVYFVLVSISWFIIKWAIGVWL